MTKRDIQLVAFLRPIRAARMFFGKLFFYAWMWRKHVSSEMDWRQKAEIIADTYRRWRAGTFKF